MIESIESNCLVHSTPYSFTRQGAAGPERSERVRESPMAVCEDGTPKARGPVPRHWATGGAQNLNKNRAKKCGYSSGLCTFVGK